MENQAEKIKKALKKRPVVAKNVENDVATVKVDDLQKGLADAENMNNALESNSVIAKNDIEEFRVQLIKDLLKRLSELGVDPGDSDSINNFLRNLEMQDPDLKELFESAFDGLLGESNKALPPENVNTTAPTLPGAPAPTLPGAPTPSVKPGISEVAPSPPSPTSPIL